MKKGLLIACVLVVSLVSGCAGLKGALTDMTGLPTGSSTMGDLVTSGDTGSNTVSNTESAVIEFKAGEVLGATDTGDRADATYTVGKILTPATGATKNQAEFLFVRDGSKQWVNQTVVSRKATKADFKIGAQVLVLNGWAGHDGIGADSYRKDFWIFGTITNTDELFKNRVEVSGNSYNISFVRIETK